MKLTEANNSSYSTLQKQYISSLEHMVRNHQIAVSGSEKPFSFTWLNSDGGIESVDITPVFLQGLMKCMSSLIADMNQEDLDLEASMLTDNIMNHESSRTLYLSQRHQK